MKTKSKNGVHEALTPVGAADKFVVSADWEQNARRYDACRDRPDDQPEALRMLADPKTAKRLARHLTGKEPIVDTAAAAEKRISELGEASAIAHEKIPNLLIKARAILRTNLPIRDAATLKVAMGDPPYGTEHPERPRCLARTQAILDELKAAEKTIADGKSEVATIRAKPREVLVYELVSALNSWRFLQSAAPIGVGPGGDPLGDGPVAEAWRVLGLESWIGCGRHFPAGFGTFERLKHLDTSLWRLVQAWSDPSD